MDRVPLNPQELEAEEDVATAAIEDEQRARPVQWSGAGPDSAFQVPCMDLCQHALDLAHCIKGVIWLAVRAQRSYFSSSFCPSFAQAELALIPGWRSQLSLRGACVGLLLGAVFCVVS
jgi:hypothetical protein